MSDLISREAVLDWLRNEWDGIVWHVCDGIELLPSAEKTQLSREDATFDCISRKDAIRIASGHCHPSNIAKELAELPSAEPEVIRCKDCEYFHKYFCEIWSKFGTIQTRENGYCYMAERRTDE